MVKVKICGITRLQDALYACELGAWAVGFIFVKSSPRYIEPERAAQIIANLPKSVEKIGVFADFSVEEICNFTEISGITKIQLHGDESLEFCEKLKQNTKIPLIKALRVKSSNDIKIIADYTDLVELILLDSYSDMQLGGTGEIFNWEIARQAKNFNLPIILAGGINPENIYEAYTQVKPYAIDLSSGVEQSKGIKDHNKLKKLFDTTSSF